MYVELEFAFICENNLLLIEVTWQSAVFLITPLISIRFKIYMIIGERKREER